MKNHRALKKLKHRTVDTGHVRDSPRHEVADETMAIIIPAIERAKNGGVAHIADVFSVALVENGEDDQPLVYDIYVGAKPVVRCALILGANLDLSVRFLPEIMRMSPDVMMMLGDLERCLAWSFIEVWWRETGKVRRSN
ncbi:hypothetical protein [Methylobacterium nodulans]|uniref:Uncharacterized protein n=1 Tax=Methylobacterium nodulans (strain LMG 21967 / CNCM I-2342 / ORS 2060) TaxID=460265 RepID=B8IY22_METNO|nr:hypothetical protein [Methylobacterium nodulans]ACL63312.1 hypothetical protein Mnod_7719 [Methylobacterium nodulans ORS 2060]